MKKYTRGNIKDAYALVSSYQLVHDQISFKPIEQRMQIGKWGQMVQKNDPFLQDQEGSSQLGTSSSYSSKASVGLSYFMSS